MAKMTLNEMTRNILSAMDSDDVNSISDTVESLQVANEIITTYYENYAGRVVPSLESLIKLDALADSTKPTFMKIPSGVKSIKWIRYNGVLVRNQKPEEFLDDSYNYKTNTMLIADPSMSANFYILTDQDPTKWTTFDNEYIVFNSYDSTVDSTLQQTKTTCWGQHDPIFPLEDDAYAPYLKGDDYPGLLADAKAWCFQNYKQVSNAKAETVARRQRVRQQNDLWHANQRVPSSRGPNYGRRGRFS